MSNKEIKEEKKFTAKGGEGKQKMMQYKTFKSKVEGLEDAVFEIEAVKYPVYQDSWRNSKICPKKYNSNVAKMVKHMEWPSSISLHVLSQEL